MKKYIALLLALVLFVGLFAFPAVADEGDPGTVTVTIEDTIKTNGSLTANVTQTAEGEFTYTYQWYVSVNGTDFTKIDNTTTVTGTAQTMYVARDGARKYYKVEVYHNNVLKVTSDAFHVEYYDALQNGSFETPDGSDVTNYYANGTPNLYWQTTGTDPQDRDIEIIDVYENNGNNHQDYALSQTDNLTETGNGWNLTYAGVPNGYQIAELNSEAWGALYQDILTEPGSTLYYSFYHRGRYGDEIDEMDTMQLLIVDAEELPENWNPSNGLHTADEGVVATSSANRKEWKLVSGRYVVPDGQYVTRFYFSSVSSFNGSNMGNGTVGNYLDGVWFSADPAPQNEQYSELKITKNIGNGNTDLEDYIPAGSFSFTATKGDQTRTVKLPTAEGEWTALLQNLEPGEWTITETTNEVSGLVHVSTNIGTSTDNINFTKVTMAAGEEFEVTFTNNYTEDNVTINYAAVGGGTVAPGSEMLPVYTGNAQGSTATANNGYTFVGWYADQACTTQLATTNAYAPAKPDNGWVDGRTYYAKFVEQTATINYVPKVFDASGNLVENNTTCTVSLNSETVNVVTGSAEGSTASSSTADYKFDGWYTDADCTTKVSDTWVRGAEIKPTKNENALWTNATYYAKFVPNKASLTIKKSGGAADECFIMNVSGGGLTMKVVVPANGSVTITGLTVGVTYTVTEDMNWAWRYSGEHTASITLAASGNTVTITNANPITKWLSGDTWFPNLFTGNQPTETVPETPTAGSND